MFENFNDFMQNLGNYANKTKFKIPNNLLTNPDEIINHLLRSEQLTQNQYNQVYEKFKELFRLGKTPKQP